jgi:hypothetical protein
MRFLGKLLGIKKRRINKYNNKQAVKYMFINIKIISLTQRECKRVVKNIPKRKPYLGTDEKTI